VACGPHAAHQLILLYMTLSRVLSHLQKVVRLNGEEFSNLKCFVGTLTFKAQDDLLSQVQNTSLEKILISIIRYILILLLEV